MAQPLVSAWGSPAKGETIHHNSDGKGIQANKHKTTYSSTTTRRSIKDLEGTLIGSSVEKIFYPQARGGWHPIQQRNRRENEDRGRVASTIKSGAKSVERRCLGRAIRREKQPIRLKSAWTRSEDGPRIVGCLGKPGRNVNPISITTLGSGRTPDSKIPVANRGKREGRGKGGKRQERKRVHWTVLYNLPSLVTS